jgi:hypothetical protein
MPGLPSGPHRPWISLILHQTLTHLSICSGGQDPPDRHKCPWTNRKWQCRITAAHGSAAHHFYFHLLTQLVRRSMLLKPKPPCFWFMGNQGTEPPSFISLDAVEVHVVFIAYTWKSARIANYAAHVNFGCRFMANICWDSSMKSSTKHSAFLPMGAKASWSWVLQSAVKISYGCST